jgi:hypothetical protein
MGAGDGVWNNTIAIEAGVSAIGGYEPRRGTADWIS